MSEQRRGLCGGAIVSIFTDQLEGVHALEGQQIETAFYNVVTLKS